MSRRDMPPRVEIPETTQELFSEVQRSFQENGFPIEEFDKINSFSARVANGEDVDKEMAIFVAELDQKTARKKANV